MIERVIRRTVVPITDIRLARSELDTAYRDVVRDWERLGELVRDADRAAVGGDLVECLRLLSEAAG